MKLQRIHERLKSEGFDIEGVSSTGRIDFKVKPTKTQADRAKAIFDEEIAKEDVPTRVQQLLANNSVEDVLEMIIKKLDDNGLWR